MKSLILTLLIFCTSSFVLHARIEDDPIRASFDAYISKHVQSYQTNKREKVSKLGGGWAKESFEPTGKFTVRAEKKNVFVCEFELKKSRTEYHADKAAAERDNTFIDATIVKHRHRYEFNQNKWSVKSRQHYNPWVGEWFDCNEKIDEGENKGNTNLEGCWEDQ